MLIASRATQPGVTVAARSGSVAAFHNVGLSLKDIHSLQNSSQQCFLLVCTCLLSKYFLPIRTVLPSKMPSHACEQAGASLLPSSRVSPQCLTRPFQPAPGPPTPPSHIHAQPLSGCDTTLLILTSSSSKKSTSARHMQFSMGSCCRCEAEQPT